MILDYQMPKMNGAELAIEIKKAYPRYPMADSIRNMTDHNMVGSTMIDTSAGVSLMNFLISLDNFLLLK